MIEQMKRKPFSKRSIASLPANEPILYNLETATGRSNYIGVAKRGRVRQRLRDHLPGGPDPIPAKTVKIKQYPSIDAAKIGERRAIRSKQPKYNKKHK